MGIDKVDPLRAFSVDEVAERLSISPYTVRELLKQGTIKGMKVGRIWRVSSEALDSYLRGTHRREAE